jgi:Glyoxalase-like domain
VSQVDHLVVTTPSLISGVEWVESVLGAAPARGGEHERMGTHNALLRLGASIYLEVIASNPDAAAPARPRWFELDRLTDRSKPQLATWVVRTDDIDSVVARCEYRFGQVEPMSRGAFKWLITIPPDGRLPGGGAIPTLIEWQSDEHPARGLEDLGLRLSRLEIFHPAPTNVSGMLRCLGLRDDDIPIEVSENQSSYLVAEIQTPGGTRTFGGSPAL